MSDSKAWIRLSRGAVIGVWGAIVTDCWYAHNFHGGWGALLLIVPIWQLYLLWRG